MHGVKNTGNMSNLRSSVFSGRKADKAVKVQLSLERGELTLMEEAEETEQGRKEMRILYL